jgi:hypothetical protein
VQAAASVSHSRRLFAFAAASAALFASEVRAEALPGRFEANGGAHFLVLAAERCEHDGDVVACSGFWLFGGFELTGHFQLAPWISLGVRAAGSKDLDGSEAVFSDGDTTDRDLWLWRASFEVRFDPLLWPRGIWLGLELGAALAVDSAELRTLDDRFAAGASSNAVGVVAGVAAGWDFLIADHVVFGLEARGQFIALSKLDPPSIVSGRLTFDKFPWLSAGFHGGYRW